MKYNNNNNNLSNSIKLNNSGSIKKINNINNNNNNKIIYKRNYKNINQDNKTFNFIFEYIKDNQNKIKEKNYKENEYK